MRSKPRRRKKLDTGNEGGQEKNSKITKIKRKKEQKGKKRKGTLKRVQYSRPHRRPPMKYITCTAANKARLRRKKKRTGDSIQEDGSLVEREGRRLFFCD